MTTTLVPDNWYMLDNWIIHDDVIRLYLENMTIAEYNYVSANRKRYDESVQSIIAEYDPPIKMAINSKLKIREMTNREFNQMEIDRRAKENKEIDEKWAAYKLQHNLERPMSQLDERCDDAYTMLLNAKGELQKELDKLPAKQTSYVAPSRRNAAPLPEKTVIVNARSKLAECEATFKKLENEIINADKIWDENSKHVFANKLKML
jgi:hypothetical protein